MLISTLSVIIVDDVLFRQPRGRAIEILPISLRAYHDKNGGDRVVTDGDLYLLDVQDVELP